MIKKYYRRIDSGVTKEAIGIKIILNIYERCSKISIDSFGFRKIARARIFHCHTNVQKKMNYNHIHARSSILKTIYHNLRTRNDKLSRNQQFIHGRWSPF